MYILRMENLQIKLEQEFNSQNAVWRMM